MPPGEDGGALPAARCRSLAILALLALAWVPSVPAGAAEPQRLALPLASDDTVGLPLEAPMPAGATGLGPGTFLLTEVDGVTYMCTANWAWTDGAAYYLGAAGHCFLPEEATSSHGADRDADVSGVRVRACVADCEFSGDLGFVLSGTTVDLGPVAYARQARQGVDVGNDFGLVRIPDGLVGEIRSALPVWGRASHARPLLPGDVACLYGHGIGVGEVYPTKARMGAGLVTPGDGSWRAALPSAMGDSGAAVATCTAGLSGTRAVGAVGVLTHLSGSGVAGTTLARAQTMAREAGLDVAPVL